MNQVVLVFKHRSICICILLTLFSQQSSIVCRSGSTFNCSFISDSTTEAQTRLAAGCSVFWFIQRWKGKKKKICERRVVGNNSVFQSSPLIITLSNLSLFIRSFLIDMLEVKLFLTVKVAALFCYFLLSVRFQFHG